MVFVDESIDLMFEKIGCKNHIRQEIMIPNKRKDIFKPSDEDSDMIMISENYLNGLGFFAQQHLYEIFELCSNSINRGNYGNWDLPFQIDMWGDKSGNGTILRLTDKGQGFDFLDYIRGMKQFDDGKSLEFECQGEGLGFMRNYIAEKLYVSYEGNGNTVNIRSEFNI